MGVFTGVQGGAGSFPFSILELYGNGDVPSGVTFTTLFTRGASVVSITVTITDIGAMGSGSGRNYVATWTWPNTAGIYHLVIEQNYSSDIITADFQVGAAALTDSSIANAVLDTDLTSHSVSNSLAAIVKGLNQGIPDATEMMTFKARYPSGDPVPLAAFTVRDSDGLRLHTAFFDTSGQAQLEMPIGTDYTLSCSRQDLQFAVVTFDVEEGGDDVIATSTYTAGYLAGL